MLDQVAIISDIHGNMTAFNCVLADIKRRGIETILCLGDLAGKGPHGAEAIDCCREICDAVVRGNWDDFMAEESDNPILSWHQDRLGEERLAYLNQLPPSYDFVISGKCIRLFHASQTSVYTRIYPSDAYDVHLDMFTNTEFTGFSQPKPDVVGYGDIHAAYSLPLYRHQKTLFNAGSVGNPLDEPFATYVILSGHLNNTQPGQFGLEIIRMPYDIEREIAEAAALDMPELEPYAMELRTAVYRGRT
ncbi:MAG: metallophosphoesterase family protein [Chloroflexi bacterium]|nr:metallophosphoesterase family protein [Chloroflexota bacterium]